MRFLLLLLLFTLSAAWAQEPSVDKAVMTQTKSDALNTFIAKKKFLPENRYPGAPNEQVRSRFESLINSLATDLLPLASKANPKAELMEAFKTAYPAFEYADTEERERAVGYFEELMDILDVKSSDGLLNRLLYGFDPQQTADARNAEALAAMTYDERAFAAKLESLTAQTAQAFLLELLGKPRVAAGKTLLWMRESEPGYTLSLTLEPKAVVVWIVKDRFIFSKQL